MKQYVDLVERILKEGGASDDRTGTGTVKIFGHQSTYNMDDGFPLLTLKKTWMKGVTHELLWLLGCHMKDEKYKDLPMTNIKYLTDNKVRIWDEWADENGDLGPVYGKQWVGWGRETQSTFDSVIGKVDRQIDGINQIQIVIDKLTKGHKNFNPMDRGLMVSAWNVSDLDDMALRPCHTFFQFQAREINFEDRIHMLSPNIFKMFTQDETWDHDYLDETFSVPRYELSLQLYQRSADTFLGVPFNIASYALLLHMVCHVTNMKPGKFVHTFGDAHLYNNHRDQVNTFLHRTKENYEGMIEMLANDGKERTFKQLEEKAIETGRVEDYWKNVEHLKTSKHSFGQYYGPDLPTIKLNPDVKNIFDFTYEDIEIMDYNPLPNISAPVSV